MPESVLDSSAVLAWLQLETGAELVRELLPDAVISTPNWSEVLQKARQHGRDADEVAGLLKSLGLNIAPLTEGDAVEAASLWSRVPSFSLADRCCLALASRLNLPAVTADRLWDEADTGVSVRVIR